MEHWLLYFILYQVNFGDHENVFRAIEASKYAGVVPYRIVDFDEGQRTILRIYPLELHPKPRGTI